MKRGVFDILRRGLDNMLVNWPLLAIRVGEGVVFAIAAVLGAIAILVPMLVSAGIHVNDVSTADDLEGAIAALLDQWMLLLWIFLGVAVLMLFMVAVHSFIEAGSARVYVDAERVAGPGMDGPRARFRVFSMDRWMAGAKDGWWAVFWIYNFAWGVAGLFLLIPLLPTLGIMFAFRETPAAIITSGCIGLLVTALLGIVVLVITGIWTNRAIAEWATHRAPASTSLSVAWTAVKRDFGRHLLVALALFVVALAASSVSSSFSFIATVGDSMGRHGPSISFFTMPARMFGALLNMIFSAGVAGWYLASFSAMTTEIHSPPQ